MIGGVVKKEIFFAAFGSANVGRKSPALKFLLVLGIAGAKFISPTYNMLIVVLQALHRHGI